MPLGIVLLYKQNASLRL